MHATMDAARRLLTAAALMVVQACAPVSGAALDAASALQARHAELRAQLADNPFHQPLTIGSSETEARVEGEAFAEIPYPFRAIAPAFKSGADVCTVLTLHLNVRGCHASAEGGDETIELRVGPKRQSFGSGYRVRYRLHVDVDEGEYMHATMVGLSGPLSTNDYHVTIEAVPLDPQRSFVHCRYEYGTGSLAKLAMRIYLNTAGRSKIGFTVVGRTSDGQPVYVGGERGSLERNAMRYYLAVLAFAATPAGNEAREARWRTWFSLTERYPAQLHELEWEEYLAEKRRDLQRQAP